MDAADREVDRLIATAKVVEYLEPVMSRDLLVKFPDNDNTAFGFDYAQSSIWSPLIPRAHFPIDPSGHVTPKKLSYGSGGKQSSARKKVAASAFKFGLRVMQSSRKKKRVMKIKMERIPKSADFCSTPMKGCSCVPLAAKGWHKVLKAASKQFKKKKKRSKDPVAHVKLSSTTRELTTSDFQDRNRISNPVQ